MWCRLDPKYRMSFGMPLCLGGASRSQVSPSGHSPHHETPETVNRLLSRWLNYAQSGGSPPLSEEGDVLQATVRSVTRFEICLSPFRCSPLLTSHNRGVRSRQYLMLFLATSIEIFVTLRTASLFPLGLS